MSRISRLAVLVTALASLFAVLSSTAGATTFTNLGGTNFHATGVGGTLGVTTAPPATTVNNLVCTSATATGSVGMGAFTQVTGTVTFSPCTLIGIETEVNCNYSLTPVSTFVGGVTGVADVHCVAALRTSPFTPLCNITGTTPGHYRNPVGSTPGQVTLTPSTSLVVSNNTDSSCTAVGVPTGQTRPGDLSSQTLTLTSAAESPLVVDP